MQGKRVDYKPGDTYGDGDDDQYPFPRLKAGEYGKDADGMWYCIPPGTDLLGSLGDGVGNKGHKVVEHEDGTITVSPSILIGNGQGGKSWHGYLENGIWREC